MNFIAGPSKCTGQLSSADANFEPALAALQCKPDYTSDGTPGELEYSIDSIATIESGCTEQVDFVVETYVVRSDCKLHCHNSHRRPTGLR